MAFGTSLRLPLISTIEPAFAATSVPVPSAMPMSAAARAGASLAPSPTMATTPPLFLNLSICSCLPPGSTPATTSFIPAFSATARAVASLSPVTMTTFTPLETSFCTASAESSFMASAAAKTADGTPSTVITTAVLPSRSNSDAVSF